MHTTDSVGLLPHSTPNRQSFQMPVRSPSMYDTLLGHGVPNIHTISSTDMSGRVLPSTPPIIPIINISSSESNNNSINLKDAVDNNITNKQDTLANVDGKGDAIITTDVGLSDSGNNKDGLERVPLNQTTTNDNNNDNDNDNKVNVNETKPSIDNDVNNNAQSADPSPAVSQPNNNTNNNTDTDNNTNTSTTAPTSAPTTSPQLNDDTTDDKIYWIDMEGLDNQEISQICDIFSIHHLTYEDITTQDSSEKSEEYSHYLFVSTSEVMYQQSVMVTSNIYLVIFNSFVLVFHTHPIDCFDLVLRSFRYLEQTQLQSSYWLLCSFLDSIHEIYSDFADTLMVEVNFLDEFTLRDEVAKSELYIRLGRAVRRATNLLSSLFIKNDVLGSLLRNNINDQEAKRHLGNIKDRLQRLQQKIKLAEELLENVGTVYISKVSLVTDEESHTLNQSMSRIVAMTTIFMPLTLVAGIFGMNIRLPGMAQFYDTPSLGWFYGIIFSMVGFVIIMTIYARKRGFL
ncbi:hypothetical protein SAMD00019534_063530, partial [Acytostelium subglobosum LB1]|uniref:hypothetical protein n=1 Tax=Acytostelium subglobosum LB1 TaxID=1410327 RepID=UPI000644F8D2